MDRREAVGGEAAEANAALWVVGAPEGASAAALAERLSALGFATRSVGGSTELAQRVSGSPRPPTGLFLDLGLPDRALEGRLRLLEPLLAPGHSTAVAFGAERPGPARRRRLAEAGVALGLFGDVDDATLRFQANRTFLGARPRGPARRDLRAPASGRVRVRSGGREKAAQPYSLSAGGAFLATPRPSLRGARLELEWELAAGGARHRLRAEVVHTNVPGNLRRRRLPAGMGVRFMEPETARAALEAEVHARSAALVL